MVKKGRKKGRGQKEVAMKGAEKKAIKKRKSEREGGGGREILL